MEVVSVYRILPVPQFVIQVSSIIETNKRKTIVKGVEITLPTREKNTMCNFNTEHLLLLQSLLMALPFPPWTDYHPHKGYELLLHLLVFLSDEGGRNLPFSTVVY